MRREPLKHAVAQIRSVVAAQVADDRSDRELIRAYSSKNDHVAFAALVKRYGSLVFSVCRRLLHRREDAEDSFQAVFIVLAKHAAAVSNHASLAGWLHRGSYRTALNCRRAALRRYRNEKEAKIMEPANPAWQAAWREVQGVLDEEIQRLPDKYREPFLLCHLENLPCAQAAQRLGIKEGTVWSRLAEARKRLQVRLKRRGITLSAVLGATAAASVQASARLPAGLIATAVKSALGYKGSVLLVGVVSEQVAALVRGTTASLLPAKVKVGATLVLSLSVMASAAGLYALHHESAVPFIQSELAQQGKQPGMASKNSARDLWSAGPVQRLGNDRLRQGSARFGFLAFSPDAKKLYSADSEGHVHVWDSATGKERSHFPTFTGGVGQLAISPDQKLIAASDFFGGKIGFWEVATGKSLAEIPSPGGARVAFAPDSQTVAATGGLSSSEISYRDARTGQLLQKVQLEGNLTRLDYMPDGKTLITKSARGIIRLWEASTGKLLHTFPQSWENNSPSYAPSPDGATLTAGHEDGLIHWDVATGKRRAKLSAQPRGVINGVAYSPDGELLAVSTHQSLHILNAKTGKELHALNGLKVRSLYIFCFTPDGKRLAAAGDDTTIRLLDVGTGEDLFPKEGYSAPTHGLRFAPDGHALLTLATSDPLLLWDLEQTRLSQAYSGDSWEMTDAHFSGDGRAIIAGDRRGIIYFWSKADGKEIRRLSLSLDTKTPFHERREFDEVTQMALSPNGRLLTVLGRHSRTVPGARAVDSTQVVRWDLATGNELFRREEPNRFPLWRLSPDGRLRASFNTKERTRIVDNETGRSCSILKGNYEYLWPVEFSPDGRLLAGFSRFGIENPIVVAVWEVATGKEVRRFTSAMKGLRCNLAFSSDGRLLAAGAQQEAGMHIWDLATGKEKAVLKGLETEVTCVAFSIDGNRLASGSTSGAVLVWEARPGPQESPPKKHLGENDLQRLLTLLAGDQADKSLEAAWELVGGEEQTVAYLKARLKPAELGSSERLNKLICDLDSAQFAVRDAATKELAKHGTDAEASLRKALERKPSAEVAQRIQSLLNAPSLFALPSHRIQELRMLEVLERIGIPDARQLLEKLSTGTPDARLTQEAKASLERLARRQGQRP